MPISKQLADIQTAINALGDDAHVKVVGGAHTVFNHYTGLLVCRACGNQVPSIDADTLGSVCRNCGSAVEISIFCGPAELPPLPEPPIETVELVETKEGVDNGEQPETT